MSTTLLSFKQAIGLITKADLVTFKDGTGDQAVCTFIGWDNEGDDDSAFRLEADGWDSLYLYKNQKFVRDGNTLKPPKTPLLIKLYKELK